VSPDALPAVAERKLEVLIGSVREYAIFLLDVDGRVETWNLGARTIKGYAPDEIIGRSFEQFYTHEDRERGHPMHLLRLAREHGRVEDEGWRVRKDGTRFFADVVITALRDSAGALIGYGKVTRDLTERRRVEEQRFESEQRFRQIVEAVRDYAIFMLDIEGRVATWNSGAARINGYLPDEIIGTHFAVFYPPDAVAAGYPERELEVARDVGRFEEEGWRVRKDGTRFWANVVLTPLHNQTGEHIGYAKVTRDLTERRAAELERVRLAQAEAAIRLRDEFMSVASHELRTPLVALQLQLDSARKLFAGVDPRLDSKLSQVDKGARRMAELVDALLDVTRIVSGRLTIHRQPSDLSEVVAEVAERFHELAASARCPLTVDIEPGIQGSWDPLRMGQVLTNLLSNACKYAAGAPVEIRLRRCGGRAQLSVVDHGQGIPAEAVGRIFERFERAVDSRHYGGLGLGLFVAREIVQAHGGVMTARNRAHGGASFEVELPITQALTIERQRETG
jgi:PAS domain S-box-containing protein